MPTRHARAGLNSRGWTLSVIITIANSLLFCRQAIPIGKKTAEPIKRLGITLGDRIRNIRHHIVNGLVAFLLDYPFERCEELNSRSPTFIYGDCVKYIWKRITRQLPEGTLITRGNNPGGSRT